MHDLNLKLSASLWQALQRHCARTGESVRHAIHTLLGDALDLEQHSLFQVSTSGALVQGVFKGCVTVADIKKHGDFGLGTFDGLDGEGILLDGTLWQARSDGSVREAPDATHTPFFVATHFVEDRRETLAGIPDWAGLCAGLDALRTSQNRFVAIRIRGTCETLRVRAACRSDEEADLVAATRHQAEFDLSGISGTLVGFWTPAFARTINVPGYHLHFLSDDHRHGGHVLELRAARLDASLHWETDIHLALPETEAFLKADLSGDPTAALSIAER